MRATARGADEHEGAEIARAIAGDSRALRRLYDRHARHVYSTVWRLVGDPALADDASQETWVRAFRNLARFRGDSPFSLWLHRIAINAALQARRTGARRLRREVPLADTHPIDAVQSRRAEQRDLGERVELALRRIPQGMRAVIVLHDVEGRTHEEIAGLLRISPGTSKSQLFKARARLRALLSHVYAEQRDASSD